MREETKHLLRVYDMFSHLWLKEEPLVLAAYKIKAIVADIRELEAENADLKNQLRAALERC